MPIESVSLLMYNVGKQRTVVLMVKALIQFNLVFEYKIFIVAERRKISSLFYC